MIKEDSIDRVRSSAGIEDVVSHFIKLDKHKKACCPFHDEKSPSFAVNPAKNIYKCFGCGAAGDSIGFVMEYEKLSFPEAVERVAGLCNIPLEYESGTEAKEDLKDEKQRYMKLHKAASRKYVEALLELPSDQHPAAADLLYKRLLDPETILEFQIGYAPDEWRYLTPDIVSKGYYDAAADVGLVKTSSDKNYDGFRHRIMFPIQNTRGEIIGFGGRALPGGQHDDGKIKYINSPESLLYKKNQVLYGLYHAQQRIRKLGKAVVVEGYFDVVSFHQGGVDYAVASCGTAFTLTHAKLLSRYCKHFIFVFDADDAGRKAAMKSIDLAVELDVKSDVVMLPDGQDPDSFARHCLRTGTILEEYIKTNAVDGFLYKTDVLLQEAGEDIDKRSKALDDISRTAAIIQNPFKRNEYIELIAKKHKIKRDLLTKIVKEMIEELEEAAENPYELLNLPKGVDPAEVQAFGFYELRDKTKTGYWFPIGANQFQQMSNFIVQPLFHLYSKKDNKRLIEIDNGFVKKIVEIPSKSMISQDQFAGLVYQECNALIWTQKMQFMKILSKISDHFPISYELMTLGQQKEGFFAFSDCLYNGQVVPFDEFGNARHLDVNYYSPSASKINEHARGDDDPYENDRYLKYSKAPINFDTWCDLMCKVYEEKGPMAIAYTLITLFRDIVYALDRNCPHFYCYGPTDSGKSKLNESISALFFNGLSAFNLNNGTDFAFFNRLRRFRNCPVNFNEFDDKVIKEHWFQAIKAIYDGEGRERGSKDGGGRGETMQVVSTLLLAGQWLSTKDDNSVLIRCIIVPFQSVEIRPEQQLRAYDELKKYEKEGLSSILTDILAFRKDVEEKYRDQFQLLFRQIADELISAEERYETRILRNYTALVTMVKLFQDKFNFPFTYTEFHERCKKEIIRLTKIKQESDSLADFWNTVVYLADRGDIQYGFDFKVDTRMDEKVNADRDNKKTLRFTEPTKLLYLRLENVQKAYARYDSKKAIDLQSLRLYITSLDSFLGNQPGSKFYSEKDGVGKSTSSYLFLYDKLGVNLERTVEAEDQGKEVELEAWISAAGEYYDLYDKPVIKFRVTHNEQYTFREKPVTKEVHTTCYIMDTDTADPDSFKKNFRVVLKGMLVEKKIGKDSEARVIRTLTVQRWELPAEGLTEAAPVPAAVQDDLPF